MTKIRQNKGFFMKKSELSSKLSEFRQFLGLNQTQFAKKLGIPRTTIIGYESGNTLPSDFLLRLHKTFNLNIEWFLFGKGSPVILKIPTAQEITNNVVRSITEENKKKLNEYEQESLLNSVSNETEIGKETNLTEESNIQSSLEELAIKATAPQFEKLDKILQRMQERITKLEQLARPDDITLAEDIRDAKPLYVADTSIKYNTMPEDEQTEDLPLAENLAAGVPIEACYNCETYRVPVQFLKNNKRYCVAKINGTSMTEAGIANGSFVLLQYTDQPINGEIMVVTNDGYTTLKRLHQDKAGNWELRYEDGSGRNIELATGEWEVKGLFVRVL